MLALPPSTRWQEAACSRAEPSPGLLAKMAEPMCSRARSVLAAGHGVHLCQHRGIGLAGTAGFFFGTHGLGTGHILRVAAGQGELGQLQGLER